MKFLAEAAVMALFAPREHDIPEKAGFSRTSLLSLSFYS
jgi:hypothetical protein